VTRKDTSVWSVCSYTYQFADDWSEHVEIFDDKSCRIALFNSSHLTSWLIN